MGVHAVDFLPFREREGFTLLTADKRKYITKKDFNRAETLKKKPVD
jgi:hypothetical protein